MKTTNYWENDINHSNFNKIPFAVRMSKGLITQAEEERRKVRYGYFYDLTHSYCGSDAPYYPDKIIDLKEFNATHFPDGRAKNKAVTTW